MQDAVEDSDGERFRLRALPILFTVLFALGISFLAFGTIEFLKLIVRLPERPQMPWITDYYFHIAELGYTLVTMLLLKAFLRGSYGLRAPDGRSFVGVAIRWGVVIGIVATVVDFWPQLLTQTRPDQPYPLTVFNIVGWFSFAGVFVGIAEEVLFRGLLVTYLTQTLPGKITFGRFSMNGAGVVVAAIYALSYSESFLNKPLVTALGQLAYAFVSGVLFAYWYEKSKSLLAPIIGHNVASVVEQALVFAIVALWGQPLRA